MAYLVLDVPLCEQTSDDTCWHAASQMIWWYWQQATGKQGPMNTLAQKYSDDEEVFPEDFIPLARKVGLLEVTRSPSYTSDILKDLLTAHGPLWCAGYWYGFGHIIVLTGIDGDSIKINDPDGGVKKTELLAWFNTKLANNLPGCLMCKDPSAY